MHRLVLPDPQRWLTPWAARGIIVVMASATACHVVRREFGSAGITLVLLAMATVVERAPARH